MGSFFFFIPRFFLGTRRYFACAGVIIVRSVSSIRVRDIILLCLGRRFHLDDDDGGKGDFDIDIDCNCDSDCGCECSGCAIDAACRLSMVFVMEESEVNAMIFAFLVSFFLKLYKFYSSGAVRRRVGPIAKSQVTMMITLDYDTVQFLLPLLITKTGTTIVGRHFWCCLKREGVPGRYSLCIFLSFRTVS